MRARPWRILPCGMGPRPAKVTEISRRLRERDPDAKYALDWDAVEEDGVVP